MEAGVARSAGGSSAPTPLFGYVRCAGATSAAGALVAQAFSTKDAKILSEFCKAAARHARLNMRIPEHILKHSRLDAYERGLEKAFWIPLANPNTASEAQMHNIYAVACVLLPLPKLQVREYGSLQRAAAAVLNKLYPESFQHQRSQVFHRSSCKTHDWWMLAWFEDKWYFSAVADVAPIGKAHAAKQPKVIHDTHLLERPEGLVAPSFHYKPQPKMLTTRTLRDAPHEEDGCQALIVEEGASVAIHLVLPQHVLNASKRADGYLTPIAEEFGVDEAWLKQKMDRQEPFMSLQRYLGLAHPQRPFAVSADVVVLEDLDDITQVVSIAEQMGHDFEGFLVAVPLSFPPALSNCDQNLQRAMCCMALTDDEPNAVVAAVEATQAFAEELLGDSIEELGSFDEKDLAIVLEGASSLVKQALAALHQAQLERLKSQAVAQYVVEVLLTEAWCQIRCRYEWKQVNERVEKWAKERRYKSKSTKRKAKSHASSSDPVPPATSVQSVVTELKSRTARYERTAKGLASLVACGVARAAVLPPKEDTHLVQLPEFTIEILPPSANKPLSNSTGNGQGAKLCIQRKQHFLELLEASAVKDHNLALAHREEAALRLALQMSFCDAGANEPVQPSSQHNSPGKPSATAFSNDALCTPLDAAIKPNATRVLPMPMPSKELSARTRPLSAPPVLLGNDLFFTPPPSSSSGGPSSSEVLLSSQGLPTTSSDSVTIYPKHPVAQSTVQGLLKDRLLPSFGTVDHSTASANTCFVCRAFQRDGECRNGRSCRRCHGPHTLESTPRGSSSRARQRLRELKATVRRSPSPGE